MFTDRFIQVPIQVYDVELKEVTGKELSTDSWMKVNPLEIAAYRPTYDDKDPDTEIVLMELKNGSTTMVYLSVSEFEKRLNAF